MGWMPCVATHGPGVVATRLDTLGVFAKTKALGLIDSFQDAELAMQHQRIYYNTHLIRRIALQLGV